MQQGAFAELLELSAAERCALQPLDVSDDAPPEEARSLLGRWGEKLVYGFLQARIAPGHTVRWVNQSSESGLAFDVVVTKEGPAGEPVVVAYVEVKATATPKRSWFEISHREWLFAAQHGDRYHIYRVFGAGTPEARLTRVVNPYRQWTQRQVGLCLSL